MNTRKAIDDDSLAIKELLHQLGYSSPVESISETINSSDENSELFVTLVDGKVVAFMSLIYFYYFPSNCRVCRITGITVDASVRGRGVGSQLIAFASEMGQQNNCKQLEVTTSLVREKTQKYYEFLGFKKASLRYYQPID